MINLDSALGIKGEPSSIDFSIDTLSLFHIGLGFASAFLPMEMALGSAMLFVGYELSQINEAMASTSTEIFEFGVGMILGALVKGNGR